VRKILILCVSIGILTLAFMLGPKAYRKWRAERAFHNAETALARNREKEALLSLQEALQSDPENLPATRMISNLLEKKTVPVLHPLASPPFPTRPCRSRPASGLVA